MYVPCKALDAAPLPSSGLQLVLCLERHELLNAVLGPVLELLARIRPCGWCCINLHVPMHIYICTCTHIYMYIYIHILTHIQIHTYTYIHVKQGSGWQGRHVSDCRFSWALGCRHLTGFGGTRRSGLRVRWGDSSLLSETASGSRHKHQLQCRSQALRGKTGSTEA